jgi:hypothetical protein
MGIFFLMNLEGPRPLQNFIEIKLKETLTQVGGGGGRKFGKTERGGKKKKKKKP